MNDETEDFRREMIASGQPQRNLEMAFRREMIALGQPQRNFETAKDKWTTEELQRDFVVHSFLAPFVVVTRKSDGVKGSLEFTHSPRFYFNFTPDQKQV